VIYDRDLTGREPARNQHCRTKQNEKCQTYVGRPTFKAQADLINEKYSGREEDEPKNEPAVHA